MRHFQSSYPAPNHGDYYVARARASLETETTEAERDALVGHV
jgi:hypothetical protein